MLLKIAIVFVIAIGMIWLMWLINTGEKNDVGEGNADSSGASGLGPE